MSQDDKIIGTLSQQEVSALLVETGMVAIEETTFVDGRPVLQASLKVINARTGEAMPGGLPFAVVLFKSADEPGFSNIAIGTRVPVAELGIALPPDFFNLCNQYYRFVRVYPLDAGSFVLQMDLFLRRATREYVKYCFGVWAATFSQLLFELLLQRETHQEPAAMAPAAPSAPSTDEPLHVMARYVSAVTTAEAEPALPPQAAAPQDAVLDAAAVAEQPPAKERNADEPHAEEPHAEEPHADEPHADEPHADEPRANEPPAADNPLAARLAQLDTHYGLPEQSFVAEARDPFAMADARTEPAFKEPAQ